MQFSPDGTSLACGDGNNVWLWNTPEMSAKGRLLGSSMQPALTYSPDGKMLAVAGVNGSIGLWNVATGALSHLLHGHQGRANAVAFSPDGMILVSGGGDHAVNLWDVATGALVRSLKQHTGGVNAVAMAPDGTLLASAGDDSRVQLWHAEAGTWVPLRTLTVPAGAVIGVAFTPDGQRLATIGSDKNVRVWDVQTGTVTRTIVNHRGIFALAFLLDTTLAVAGFDSQEALRLWNIGTGEALATMSRNQDPIRAVAASRDGRLLASAGQDGLRLWDAATHQLLWASPDDIDTGFPFAVAIAPNGQQMATTGMDGIVHLWSLADPSQPRQVAALLRLPGTVPVDQGTATPTPPPAPYITVTPEGYYVATPGADNFVRWRVGDRSWPAASFRAVLNRPELVQQVLAGLSLPPVPTAAP